MSQTTVRFSQIRNVPLGNNPTSLIKADNTEATFTNSSAENTLYSATITGGVIGVNDAIRFQFFGSLLNSSGAGRTYTFRLKYGGTTIASVAVATVNSSGTTFGFIVSGMMKNAGATNSQKAVIGIQVQNMGGSSYTAFGTAAVDSTVNETLTLTIQSDAATATQTVAELETIIEYAPAT